MYFFSMWSCRDEGLTVSQISASIHNNRTETHDAVELLVLLMLCISCVSDSCS